MATSGEADPELDPAHERIAGILRAAIGGPEEEALEDATRRLMLQLSIEPPEAHRVPAKPIPDPPRTRLLRRLLRRARRGPA